MNDREYRKLKNEVQKMNKRVKELREAGFKYDTDFNLPLSLSKTKLEENAKIARKINADPKSYIKFYRNPNIQEIPVKQESIKNETPIKESQKNETSVRKETYAEKKERQKREKAEYRKQKKEKKKDYLIIKRANKKARELEQLKLQKKSAAYLTQKMIQKKRLKAKYGDAWTSEDTKKFLNEPLRFTRIEDAEKFLNESTSSADLTYKAIEKTFKTIKNNDRTGVIKTDEDARLLMLAIEKDNGEKFKNANYGSDVALNEYKALIKEYKEDLESNNITDADLDFMDYVKTKNFKNKFDRAKRR